ncbi:polysaccharide deacetylase family protein [Acidobacteriota bacterium]
MKAQKDRHPIALTVDLEFWWNSEFLKGIPCESLGDIIEPAAESLLNSMEDCGIKATFFVLGEVAEKYPRVIQNIHKRDHEIANHGYSHTNVFELTPDEFEKDVKRSTVLLKSITGVSPVGYRAPNFSFSKSTAWAYPILEDNGYSYSSSLFPFKTRLYGVPEAPISPYSPSREDITVHDPEIHIREYPATVIKCIGKTLPISGGFYFRILPAVITKNALKGILKTRPASFYIHLRDLYPNVPRLKDIPWLARFFHYYGLNTSMKKFEYLLARFNFETMKSIITQD